MKSSKTAADGARVRLEATPAKRDINALSSAEYQAYLDMAEACDATLEGLADETWFVCTAAIITAHIPFLDEDDREVLTSGIAELHTYAIRARCGIAS